MFGIMSARILGMEFNMDYFYYIITGETPSGYPRGAKVFKSNLDIFEFKDWVGLKSEKLHEVGKDRVFKYGVEEFVNPKVFIFEDFRNYLPEIVEISK